MSLFEHSFTGRRPSQSQIIKVLKQGIKDGASQLNIDWGENWLRFERNPYALNKWTGYGWIRTLGGDELAKQLNRGYL